MLTEELPPEAFLDGPPPDADLLLQRTLGTVRAERGRVGRRRGRVAATATAALIAATLAGGVFLGQDLGDDSTFLIEGGTATGARLSVQMVDTEGGARFVATVDGITEGEQCWLVIHTRDGQSIGAGSWLANEKSVTLPGATMVSADDITGVSVMGPNRHELLHAHMTT